MKKVKIESWDERLIQNVEQKFRILGYNNNVDFIEVKRHKGKIKMFLSLNPLNKRGKPLLLKEMGYKDKWSKGKKAIEQFNISLSQEQLKKLMEDLLKQIKSSGRKL